MYLPLYYFRVFIFIKDTTFYNEDFLYIRMKYITHEVTDPELKVWVSDSIRKINIKKLKLRNFTYYKNVLVYELNTFNIIPPQNACFSFNNKEDKFKQKQEFDSLFKIKKEYIRWSNKVDKFKLFFLCTYLIYVTVM